VVESHVEEVAAPGFERKLRPSSGGESEGGDNDPEPAAVRIGLHERNFCCAARRAHARLPRFEEICSSRAPSRRFVADKRYCDPIRACGRSLRGGAREPTCGLYLFSAPTNEDSACPPVPPNSILYVLRQLKQPIAAMDARSIAREKRQRTLPVPFQLCPSKEHVFLGTARFGIG